MDFNELAYARRSVRGFVDRDVSEGDVVKMLEAARYAPSAGNGQPWHFFVVRDKSVIKEIYDKSSGQESLMSAPLVVVVCAVTERSEAKYGRRGRELYCIQDTAAAIQNILLCAESLGLGGCWCGAFKEDAMSDILRLSAYKGDMRPVAFIPIGYPDSKPDARSRRSVEEIATFI